MIEEKKDNIRGIELNGQDVPKPQIDPEGKVLESLVDFLNRREQVFETTTKPTVDNPQDNTK